MPNRIIKESIRTSPVFAKLTAEAERLYHRLITVADDYGRFDADPRVLLANCFPLMIESISSSVVAEWRDELSNSGLIRIYEVCERSYGVFTSWAKEQRQYGLKPKFPEPPADSEISPQIAGNARSHPRSENWESKEISDIRKPVTQAQSSAKERVLKIIREFTEG